MQKYAKYLRYLKDPRVRATLVVLLALAGGGTVVITVDGDGGRVSPAPSATATATPEPPAQGSHEIEILPGDMLSDLRSESGISAADRAANEAIGRRLTPRAPSSRVSAIGPKCIEDFSGHVYSSRNGVRPTEFHLHYTVSRNVPGWADVRAIQSYFKNTRVGSATFILDFEGHCLKMVPLREKAWTAGNANPYAISVEIIATGSESNREWRAAPIFQKRLLAGLARRVMDAYGLPLRRVDPVGCVFIPGWADHDALECGNDHHDVRPTFPYRVFGRQLHAIR